MSEIKDKELELENEESFEEDEIVELIDEFGEKKQFYFIGTMEYKEVNYAFFQPAELIEGAEPEDVVIFEVKEEGEDSILLPVEDEELLQEVFDEFQKEYDEEYDEGAEELS